MEPTWVPESAVRAIHLELLAEHGGLAGAAREGSLEAASARPKNLFVYTEPIPSPSRFAASYGFALAKGHCFTDGNKRVALAIIDVFLQLNGHELTASEEDAVLTIRAVATSDLSETELGEWIEANSRSLSA